MHEVVLVLRRRAKEKVASLGFEAMNSLESSNTLSNKGGGRGGGFAEVEAMALG